MTGQIPIPTRLLYTPEPKILNSFLFFFFQAVEPFPDRQRPVTDLAQRRRDAYDAEGERHSEGGVQRQMHHQHRELDGLATQGRIGAQSLWIHLRWLRGAQCRAGVEGGHGWA